jgi:hypothetical protein
MVLSSLPWDSAVISCCYCLHGLDCESLSGAHCVAPEAASKIKAQAETKFQMYCFVLC